MFNLKGMKLFYFSGAHPSINNQKGVPFIDKRFELVKEAVAVDRIYSLINQDSFAVRLIKRRSRLNYKQAFQNHLINVRRKPNPWYLIAYNNGLMINVLDMLSPGFKIKREISGVENAFLGSKRDLIHVHWAYPAGYIMSKISAKYETPYIVTAHGSDIHSVHSRNRPLVLETLEKAKKCIFVSKTLKTKALEIGYSGHNSVVIPNGFDPKIFYFVEKGLAKKEIDCNSRNVVGFVGNLYDVKNVLKLPDIFARIHTTNHDVDFVIVGDGYLKTRLVRKFHEVGLRVRFTGNVPQKEVGRYMRALDVMILPSKNEGWPCVIKEAQACGTYVVGSDSGGIPEAIGLHGKTFSHGPDFCENIANHVLHILATGYDHAKLVKSAAPFSWSSIVRKELEIYSEVVEGAREEAAYKGRRLSSTH